MILARITFRAPIFIPGQAQRVLAFEPGNKANAGSTVQIKDNVVLIIVPPSSRAGSGGESSRAEIEALKLDPASLGHIIEIPRADCTFQWLALPEAAKAYADTGLVARTHPHPDTHKRPAASVAKPKPTAPAPAPKPDRPKAHQPTRRDRNMPPGWSPKGAPSKPSVIIEDDLNLPPEEPPPADEAPAE